LSSEIEIGDIATMVRKTAQLCPPETISELSKEDGTPTPLKTMDRRVMMMDF
jgi:hypothetical protein